MCVGAGQDSSGDKERLRPRRGVIFDFADALSGPLASPVAPEPSTRRAATFSGWQSNRSAGPQSRTERIRSRWSSRIEVGFPPPEGEHLPGTDLRSGIGEGPPQLRRLPDASLGGLHSHVPAHQLSLRSGGRYPLGRALPCPFDVFVLHVDIEGRRRQPRMAEELLDCFEVHPARIEEDAQ